MNTEYIPSKLSDAIKFGDDEPYYNTAPKPTDAQLIAEMRNALVPLLDRLEKFEQLRKDCIEKLKAREEGNDPDWDGLYHTLAALEQT